MGSRRPCADAAPYITANVRQISGKISFVRHNYAHFSCLYHLSFFENKTIMAKNAVTLVTLSHFENHRDKSFLFFCYYTISKSIQSRHALPRILIFVSKYTFIEYISLFLHLFHLHLLEQTQFVHPPLSYPSLPMLFCILCYQAQICIRDLLMPIKETANTVDGQLYFDFKFD